jgi:hypothetical protein
VPSVSEAHDEQTLSKLRDPVPRSLKNARVGRVAQLSEALSKTDQNGPILPSDQIGDILQKDRSRPQFPDNPEKSVPEVRSPVILGAAALPDQASQLGTSGA